MQFPCGLGTAFSVMLETRADVTITGTEFSLRINGHQASADFAEIFIHSVCPEVEGADKKSRFADSCVTGIKK